MAALAAKRLQEVKAAKEERRVAAAAAAGPERRARKRGDPLPVSFKSLQ